MNEREVCLIDIYPEFFLCFPCSTRGDGFTILEMARWQMVHPVIKTGVFPHTHQDFCKVSYDQVQIDSECAPRHIVGHSIFS